MKIKLFATLTAFLYLVSSTTAVSLASTELEERYILIQEEQIRAKQMRADEIANHVTAMEQQMHDERIRMQQANEKIWRNFNEEQEVKRKTLQDQLEAIDERTRRFEGELEKKRFQDSLRFDDRENEMKRLMMEMQRLHEEVQQDRKGLDNRIEQMNKRKAQAIKNQSKFKDGGRHMHSDDEGVTNLESNAIKIGGFQGNQLIGGSKPFHLRSVNTEYFMEIGDVIEIDVWRVDDLTRTVTVRPDGRISMPLVGDLEVVGMSLTQLRDVLTEKFSEYVISPQVSIALNQFGGRKFVILGEVSGPGVYRYQQQIHLLEAIGLAGGFSPEAKMAEIMVIRGDIRKQPKVKIIKANLNNVLKQGMLTENIAVMPNDIIYVGKSSLGDYNEVLKTFIEPAFNTIIDFFVVRSAIRTAQQKGP